MNGIIYKITSPNTSKIYIGSTTQNINQRYSQHISFYKLYLKNKAKYTTSFEIISSGNSNIELVELIDDINNLHSKEKYYIQLNKINCVNKQIPTRTKQQWENDNKIKRKQQYFIRYNNNKDKIIKKVLDRYYYNKEYNKTIKEFYKINI